MNQISIYLEKFRNLLPFDSKIKEALVRSIKEITGKELHYDDIKVSDSGIFINTEPIIKSEIMINIEKIKDDISHAIDPNHTAGRIK